MVESSIYPLLPLSSLESSCLPLPGYHCYSVGGKTADSSLMLPWGSGWPACCTNRQENRRSMNIARLKEEVVMSESVGVDEVVDGSDSRALLASYSVIASFASSCPIMWCRPPHYWAWTNIARQWWHYHWSGKYLPVYDDIVADALGSATTNMCIHRQDDTLWKDIFTKK